MKRIVCFDLDDTLVDHDTASRAAICAVRKEIPPLQRVNEQALIAESHRLLDELHGEVALGKVPVGAARVQRYQRLLQYAGAADRVGTAEHAAALHRAYYEEASCLVAGALEVLRALAGRTKVVVVTNGPVSEQSKKLEAFGLVRYVDVLITSEQVGRAKPDRAIFDAAMQRAECVPRDAVMVGDSWPNDVMGALGAGMRAVWFNRFGKPCPEPGLAEQIDGFEATERVVELLLAV